MQESHSSSSGIFIFIGGKKDEYEIEIMPQKEKKSTSFTSLIKSKF